MPVLEMPSSLHSARYGKFREALVSERKAAGITQEELSTLLKKPQSFISKYERGERRLDVAEFFEIAHAIGFDPIDFMKRVLRKY